MVQFYLSPRDNERSRYKVKHRSDGCNHIPKPGKTASRYKDDIVILQGDVLREISLLLWDLRMSENSGRVAWERKWNEKEPGKVASSFGISLMAKR